MTRDSAAREELVAARRALLCRPLIVADMHPEEYRLVIRRLPALRSWFVDRLGWQLHHDHADRIVRLVRKGHHAPPVAPVSSRRTPMTSRRLALGLVAAALLAEHPAVAAVTAVALRDRIADTCRSRDDLPDLDLAGNRRDRDDLYAALRWLVDDVGALIEVDGDLRGAIDATTADGTAVTANAILRVRAGVPGLLLSTDERITPTTTPESLTAETPAATEGARDEQHRRRIARHFVDRPAALAEDVGSLSTSQQRATVTAMLKGLSGDLGLELERRAEGWAGIDTDPTNPLANVAFPHSTSTVFHCALLLAGRLATRARDGEQVVARSAVPELVEELIATHGRRARWAKGRLDRPATLATDALAVLVEHDLVRPHGDHLQLRPLLGRYAAADPTPPSEPQQELIDG